jgi:hypothetical protein
MSHQVNQVRKARSALRRALIEAQDNRCAYCFEPMASAKDADNPLRATLEHVFPQDDGGTDATSVAAHSVCNYRKRGRAPTACELLALDWVRTRVHASPRLTALVHRALQVLGNAPSWARFGKVTTCNCRECLDLDAKHPNEGAQLLLPIIHGRRPKDRTARAASPCHSAPSKPQSRP